MERIETLINQLKDQFDQKAGSAQLLQTLQLLQYELSQEKPAPAKSLGTSKVAVTMPADMRQYERYAPQPQEQSQPQRQPQPQQTVPVPEPVREVAEVKETVLVEKDSISIVQENGQLDMVFDPMKEIPTLAHQLHEKEVNSKNAQGESLNDKLRQGKTELVEVLKETPIKDLRKAIGINDRFLFINDLFRGDEAMYERSIKTINSFNIYPEAEYWISRELKVKIGWNNDNPNVQHFDQLVKRRFS